MADGEWMKLKNFGPADYIEGQTLKRYMMIGTAVNGQQYAWCREPTDYMLENQCDGCERVHRPHNTRCSMTLGNPSPFVKPVFYSFSNRTESAVQFAVMDIETRRHSLVSRVLLARK